MNESRFLGLGGRVRIHAIAAQARKFIYFVLSLSLLFESITRDT